MMNKDDETCPNCNGIGTTGGATYTWCSMCDKTGKVRVKPPVVAPVVSQDSGVRFEVWAASEGFDLVRHADETYATQECHDAWLGWQAALASNKAALYEERAHTFMEVGTTERGSAINASMQSADQAGFTRGTFKWCSIFADALARHVHLVSNKAAVVAVDEPKDWRVGLFWSSYDPKQQVRALADGVARIAEYEKHHSFVKWIDDQSPAPTSSPVTDQDIQEAALDWQCDPAFDHFLFNENDLVKYVRTILER